MKKAILYNKRIRRKNCHTKTMSEFSDSEQGNTPSASRNFIKKHNDSLYSSPKNDLNKENLISEHILNIGLGYLILDRILKKGLKNMMQTGFFCIKK